MKKKNNKKGFTLAELLIVVAIIAVLTAIAIPVFSTQLEKSKEATDKANVRSAYAEVVTQYLTDDDSHQMTVSARQTQSGWQTSESTLVVQRNGSETELPIPPHKAGEVFTVAITDSGEVSLG